MTQNHHTMRDHVLKDVTFIFYLSVNPGQTGSMSTIPEKKLCQKQRELDLLVGPPCKHQNPWLCRSKNLKCQNQDIALIYQTQCHMRNEGNGRIGTTCIRY